MQIMLPKVSLLEILTKPDQDKNQETGKYVDNGKMKNLLIAYPYGQDVKFKQAGCLNIQVDDLRLNEIKPFLGKTCMLELDQEQTSKGFSFYRFINVYNLPTKAAA